MGVKSLVSAMLAAFTLLAAPAWGQGVPAEAAAHLARAMDAHTTALARDGYALAAGPLVDAARHQGGIQVRLWAGQDYMLAAACEARCGALALRVVDPNGAVLGESAAGAAASLRVLPQLTGRHTLQARMASCRAQSCWFAINVYAR